MIPAAEHSRCTGLFPGDRVCAMTANIVERANLIVLSSDQEDGEACHVKRLVGTWPAKLTDVGKI